MKYGFVYIWYDKKYKRYYVGCRWGTENDGYICSSRWMISSYKRRPDDFKRRILSRVYSNRDNLLAEEYRWLSMMKQDELHGTRYYNIRNHHFSHWASNEERRLSISEKISNTMKAKHEEPEYSAQYMETRKRLPPQTTEACEKRRKSMMGKNAGRPKTEAFYKAMEKKRGTSISEEHKKKIRSAGIFASINTKRVRCPHCGIEGNPGNIARYHMDKCKQKVT